MQDNNSKADVSYIKAIMSKAEIAYKEFSWYFFIMAIYNLVMNFVLSLISADVYSEVNFFQDLFKSKIIMIACKCIWLVPIIFIIAIFRKQIKIRNLGMSLWLFDIMNYIVVFCGALLPIINVAVINVFSEGAELFFILTVAVCILLCGIFTDSKGLRIFSYIYLIIAMATLGTLGMIITYKECSMYPVSVTFTIMTGYVNSFFYGIYPSIGYLVLMFYMRGKAKRV